MAELEPKLRGGQNDSNDLHEQKALYNLLQFSNFSSLIISINASFIVMEQAKHQIG